jgi:poly(A) polymerase
LVRFSPDDRRQQFAREVARRLRDAGYRALFAGGCVRDLLLGLAPDDYDVATDARPDEVQALFGRRRTVAVGASFGVILVLGPRGAGDVEVATFRTEGPYSDGRRPDHVVYSTPEADASRRDFTINGMFCDPFTGEVLDFVGGRRDLKAGVLRAIGDPEARFAEDKLRLLRAVRFAATLGFPLERETHRALVAMADQIRAVSAERIAQELRRMLVHARRAPGLQLAYDVGLVAVILPELLPMVGLHQGKPVQPDGDLWQHTLLVLEKLKQPSFELALAALLHDVGKPATGRQEGGVLTFHNHEHVGRRIAEAICRRLRLSNKETERVAWLVEHHMYLCNARSMRWSKLKRMLAHVDIDELIELHRVDALATDGDLSQVDYCRQLLAELPEEELNPPRLLTGHDLIRRGVPQGPVYHELLDKVRDAQLEGRVRSKKQALALVDELLVANGGGGE